MSCSPAGWCRVPLGEVCELLNGRAYKQEELLGHGKYPVLRVGNFFSNRKWYYSNLELDEEKYCDDGDLLYAWSASFGPKIWHGSKTIFHYHIWKTQLNEKVLHKGFLFNWFEWDKENIKAEHGTGSTMIHVTKGDMEARAMLLPPALEQKRIVAKIDILSAKSARTRDRLDHIPRLVEKYKQAVLKEAFARVDGSPLVRLDQLTTKVGSGSTPRGGSSVYTSTGTPLIRSQNVYFEGFSLDGLAYIDDAAAKALNGVVVRTNDVLLNITGASIGRACIVPSSFVGSRVNQHVAIIRCIEALDPNYLLLFLWSPDVQGWIGNENYGVTRQALTKSMIEGIEVPLPSPNDQRRLVRRIETAFAQIDRLAAEATSARKLVDRLDQAVLAKAFRGELVPQDPNDEPASVLLDQIRAERAAAPMPKRGRKPRAAA